MPSNYSGIAYSKENSNNLLIILIAVIGRPLEDRTGLSKKK